MMGFCVDGRTLFARMKDVYPECDHLIADSPQLHQMFCLRGMCHRNVSCFDVLARRIVAMHDAVGPRFPGARSLILYWRFRDRTKPADLQSGAGIGGARVDLTWQREPYLLNSKKSYVLNPKGWKRLVELGTGPEAVPRGGGMWEWEPPRELWTAAQAPIIHGDAALVVLNPRLGPALEVVQRKTLEVVRAAS